MDERGWEGTRITLKAAEKLGGVDKFEQAQVMLRLAGSPLLFL